MIQLQLIEREVKQFRRKPIELHFEYFSKAAELGDAEAHYHYQLAGMLSDGMVLRRIWERKYTISKKLLLEDIQKLDSCLDTRRRSIKIKCEERVNIRHRCDTGTWRINQNADKSIQIKWVLLEKEELAAALRAIRPPKMQPKIRRGRQPKNIFERRHGHRDRGYNYEVRYTYMYIITRSFVLPFSTLHVDVDLDHRPSIRHFLQITRLTTQS